MEIREVKDSDFDDLMHLYSQLGNNPVPEKSDYVLSVWKKILSDPDYHIVVADVDGAVVSTCACTVVSNLTHSQRPYAFVENVVTDENYRGKGFATACLNYAKEIAIKNNCYKMMLMTGSKNETTLNFYRNAGYNDKDKTAFIQWVE